MASFEERLERMKNGAAPAAAPQTSTTGDKDDFYTRLEAMKQSGGGIQGSTEKYTPEKAGDFFQSEEDNEEAEERNFLGRAIDFLKRGSDASADAYKATADYYKANAGKPTIGGYLGEKAVGGALETVEGNVNTLAYLQQLMAKGYEMQAANAMGHAGAVTGNEYIDEQARKQQADALEHLHTPTETVANFGDRFTQNTEEKYADADFGKLIRFAGDVAQGFGGMVPVMASNALLPGAGQAVMAAGAFGNAAQEAKKQGKTGMDVAAYAAATAAVEYATEKIWGGMGGIMGKGALDDVVKKAIENGVKNGAARAGLTALVSVLGEGVEEFLAEYGGLVANKLSIKTDTRTALEALPDAERAALVGGILGGLLNAGEIVQAGQSLSPEQAADAAVAEMENSAQRGVSPEMGMDIPKAENADIPRPGAPGFEEDQGARATVENNMKQFADFDAYWKDLQKRKALAEHRERYAEGEAVHPAIEAVKAIEAEERAAVNMAAQQKPDSGNLGAPGFEEANTATETKAEGYGEYGTKALSKVMEDYGLDENTADAMFKSAYEAGRVEVAREKAELANPIQEAAYEAGRQDAIMSKSTLETGENSEYTGINKTTETESLNDGAEEIHLRNGSQWAGSENTGGQIPGMEEGSGRNQSRKAEGGPADSETAALSYGRKVSTASLGIAGGSRKNTIRLVTGGNTKATTEARRIAKERGLRVIFFAGNNMEITQADGSVVSARAFITGDRVFIRVDHADYTSDQLMRHEAGHDMIAKGEINPNDVRKRIAQSFGKEKAGQLADMYAEAYEGTGMSAEEVWEEVICDSLGDMNIFSKTARETHAWELLKEVKAASAETKSEASRAPPVEGKASRENGRRAQRGRSIELETMENNRFERLRQFGDKLPKAWYAYSRKYLYTYENIDRMDYHIIGKAPVADQVLCDIMIEEVTNGTIRTAKDFNRRLKNLRSETGRHHSGHDSSEGGRAAMGNGGLSGNRGEQSSRQNGGVRESGGNQQEQLSARDNISDATKAFLDKHNKAKRIEYLEDRLKSGKLKPEQKTLVRQEIKRLKEEFRMPKFSREIPLEERKANNKAALDHFGRTFKWAETGYVLLDGSRLDFSGRHDGAPGGYRTVDHREIRNALGDDYGGEDYSGSLIQFMSEGNVRIMPETAGINLSVMPTKAQLDSLSDFVSRNRGEVILDIDDLSGRTISSTEYPRGTHANKVIADIKKYFETGETPHVSELAQFRYSRELDSLGNKLTKEQSEYFKDSKAVDANGNLQVVYHGTRNGGFTVFNRNQNWYSSSRETSESYAPTSVIYEGYVNITKPFIIDAQDDKWSSIAIDADTKKMLEKYGSSTFKERGKWRTSTADIVAAVQDMVDEGEADYDGVIILNVDDTGSYFKGKGGYIGNDYITFNSNQFKNKDNLKPTEDKDIRYSRDLDSIEQMQKDDAALRDANREIKHLYNSGKLAKMDKATLTRFAKDIVKGATSKADVAEVTEQLRALHEYLIAGEEGNKGDWNTAFQQAYEIAADILENVSEIDDSMYQQYKDLRNTIRTTGISISKEYDGDMQGYESLNDFRKANFGRIKLVKDGQPVDVFYQELANSYPEFFDETEYTNPADQLNHIAEVLDELKPFEVNPFNSNMGEATTWLAEDIMMRFYRVQNEKLAVAVKRGKDNALKARRREIAKRDEKIKTLKQKQRAKEAKMSQSRQASILRAKIQRHIGPMKQKLLRPSDKQHVPQELREAVAAMLDAINLESGYDYVPGSQHKTSRGATVGKRAEKGSGDPTKRTEEFRNVQELYKKIINESKADDLVIDPALIGGEGNRSMLDEVIAMRDTPIASMSVAQLQTVWDCIRAIEHSISEAGKTLAKTKFATTKAFAEAFVKDTASRKAINRDMAADKRAKDLETPYTFFSRYGEAGMEFYRALRNAQDAEQIMQDELVELVGKIVSSEQKKKLEKDVQVFTTVSGDELTLSKAHVMEIYLLNKREQARGHLTAGGIVQPEAGKVKRGSEPVLLTEADVLNIIGSLTEEEQKMADALQKLTLWLAEKGNEASMKVYGYEKFGDPNYWTIRSANEQIAQTVEKNRDNPRSIANMGSAKPLTPNASNALDISGVFDTFSRHASDMLTYSAWLATMEDANRLFNFKFKDDKGNITGKNMQTLLNKVGGAASTNYWLELMKDIQNGIQNPADTGIEGVAKKIVANTKKASVSANIRVVIQQPTAIARATAVLNPAYLTAALGKDVAVKPAIDGWNKAVKYAPIASRKAAGGYEVSSNPKQLADLLYKPNTKKGKVADGIKEAPLWLAGEADKVTWGTIWNACEMQVKARNKGLAGEAFYAKVAELFTEVIDQTQVVDGVLQRSQAMRSGSSLMQQMTSFTGEPTMAANMVIRAYDNVRREQDAEKRKAGRKKLARTLGAYILTAWLNAYAQSIIDAMRDDEDEDKFWKKVKKHMWGVTGKEEKFMDRIRNVLLAGNMANNLNPLTWIPILKDVVSIVQGYSVERMDAASLSDFFSDITLAAKSLSGEGKYTVGYAMTKVMASGGKILGISVANIIRDVESVIDTIHFARDDIEGMYEVERLISTIPNNKARYADLAYMAYIRGDMELHERIRQDMIAAGVDAGYIKTAMDNRMKETYGIDDVKLLPQRYMTPEQQKSYDAVMDEVEKSSVWNKADARVRKNVSYDYYELVTGASAAEGMVAKMEAASKYGIDSVEFLLYEAALGMADKPNENGSYGTFTNDEYVEAINAVPGLSRSEKSNFWEEVLGKSEKTNPWG